MGTVALPEPMREALPYLAPQLPHLCPWFGLPWYLLLLLFCLFRFFHYFFAITLVINEDTILYIFLIYGFHALLLDTPTSTTHHLLEH